MNDEARDVFLIMINTGLRPSNITDAPLDDFETRVDGATMYCVTPRRSPNWIAPSRGDPD
jgi:hypothetical protein